MKESKDVSFNPNLPVVVSISGYRLQSKGWVRENGIYKKDGMELRYEGDGWLLNDSKEKIQFMDEIKQSELFGEDYYMNGIESGLSNYVNYRWMPELTLLMAKSFIEIFGVNKESIVLDFGCSRGYFVKALREHGVNSFGVDISEWAIENCDEDVVGYVSNRLEYLPQKFDYIFSKDVLEHIPTEELTKSLKKLFNICDEALVFIVPLAKSEGGEYIYPADELDKTHIHRKTLQGWVGLIEPFAKDFTIFSSNKIPSLKKASEQFRGSTGIIYCKKIKQQA